TRRWPDASGIAAQPSWTLTLGAQQPTSSAGRTISSHLPVDNDIQQLGTRRGKGAAQGGVHRVGLGDVLGRHTHGSGQCGKINLGIGEINADEMIVPVK